jgi:TctA family transporter
VKELLVFLAFYCRHRPDDNSGIERFTCDIPSLIEGMDLVVVALGLFSMPECIERVLRVPCHRRSCPACFNFL